MTTPVADQQEWVELRVHGVSGTPPESLLLSTFVKQVGGDTRGRFFRPADSLGNERQQQDGRILEAYHWGRFTSGSWTQALWLLIIPFGLVNAAAFTLPPIPGNSAGGGASTERHSFALASHTLAVASLRVISLALTCLLVFSSVVAGMDLFAWQLGNAGDGSSRRLWMLAGMALPVGALLLFTALSRMNGVGQAPDTDRRKDRGDTDDDEQTDLERDARVPRHANSAFADRDFFAGDPDVPTLRRLHQAASLALVALLACWPPMLAGDTAASRVVWGPIAVLGLTLVVVTFLGDPQTSETTGWHKVAKLLGWLLVVGSSLLVVIAGFVYVLHDGPLVGATPVETPFGTEPLVRREMPGIAGTALILLVVATIALVVLYGCVLGSAVAARRLRQRRLAAADPGQASRIRAFQPFGGGMAGVLLAAVAVFLGVGFAAAFDFAVQVGVNVAASILGSGTRVTIPEVLQRVGYAWGLTVLMLALIGVVTVLIGMTHRKAFAGAATTAYGLTPLLPDGTTERVPLPDTEGIPPGWVKRVASAMFLSRIKLWIPTLFWIFAIVGTVLSLVAGVEQLRQPAALLDSRYWALVDWMSELNGGRFGWIAWLGANTLALLAVSLLVLGRGAIEAENARRGLNVVWDVVAFWPRAVHPFVPPPYSQNVVAILRRRISWHLGTLKDPTAGNCGCDHRRVVVAAHSQGSLISLAALMWLRPEERERVGFVTFGSQIQQQFAKAFPTAVNDDVVDWLWTNYGNRWRNLYRDTDPIAGPVLSWHHGSVKRPGDAFSDNIAEPANLARPLLDQRSDPISPRTGRRDCGPDWRLLDPPRVDPALMAGQMSKIRGHSDYPADPDWDRVVQAVLPRSR